MSAESQPRVTLADIPVGTISRFVKRVGGATIISTQEFQEFAIPEEVYLSLVREQSPALMSSLLMVSRMTKVSDQATLPTQKRGVSGIDLLEKVCEDLRITKPTYITRDSYVAELRKGISEHLETQSKVLSEL